LLSGSQTNPELLFGGETLTVPDRARRLSADVVPRTIGDRV
jgi:hypothetical protein